MARRRKLTPAQIRSIFKSTDPAAKIAARHKVSQTLVYLIQGRKIHGAITKSIRAPRRTRRRRAGFVGRAATVRIDLDRLANKIVKVFLSRLRGGG